MLAKKLANNDVFINCPFDPKFLEIFRAVVFAVRACGFSPRCAQDENDGAKVRIGKIYDLIGECDWGIHNLSEVTLDERTNMPRFNMPLELGISLGARRYGGPRQRMKRILILDREAHNYDASTSDLSGQDNACHGGQTDKVIKAVRDWFADNQSNAAMHLPGGQALVNDYNNVRTEIDKLINAHKLDSWTEMTHTDYLRCLDAALIKLSPAA